MSTRKTTVFYVLLTAVASFAVALVIASRLELTPASSAQTVALPTMNSAPLGGAIDAVTFRNIAKAQSAMVVNIRTEMRVKAQDLSDFFGGGGGGGGDEFFRRFFGPGGGQDDQDDNSGRGNRGRRPQQMQKAEARGTGFIINAKDGFILTNNHVVEDATKIEVQFLGDEDDDTYTAKVIGKDALTDSALIQLIDRPTHPLGEAKFGDSSQMAAGDWVMAIGNPFGLAHTVSVGVVSAVGRPYQPLPQRSSEMKQTDAAINPGNSGGPLLNIRGEVIGINTAIISNDRATGSSGNIGIGFAVPINSVRELLPQLRQGKIVRGRIGVQVLPVPREAYEDFGLKTRAGAMVAQVTAGGASAKAGILPGDIIVEYNGRPIPNQNELVKMVIATKPGTSVPIKVMRERQEKTLNVTVEELDLDAEQQVLRGGGRGGNNNAPEPEEQGAAGFGLTLQNLTPQMLRRLQMPSGRSGALVTDVDPNSDSVRALRMGDVILSVNGKSVTNAAEAGRELQTIMSGRIARILIWRFNNDRGDEVFVTVKKE
jgi:serine protease Do